MIRCGDCDYFSSDGECCLEPPKVVINVVDGRLLWVRPPMNSDQGCGQGVERRLITYGGTENDEN